MMQSGHGKNVHWASMLLHCPNVFYICLKYDVHIFAYEVYMLCKQIYLYLSFKKCVHCNFGFKVLQFHVSVIIFFGIILVSFVNSGLLTHPKENESPQDDVSVDLHCEDPDFVVSIYSCLLYTSRCV